MDVTTIERAIRQLKQNILNNIHHETLFQHLGEPTLLDQQLFFLILPKLNGEKWDQSVETAVISAGVVHASLAEHAKINEEEITKEQQLTVLSGDFYSGRYYQVLAHAQNVQLIKLLSKAVVKRSEKTIALIEAQVSTLESWVEAITVIETALIESFYEQYGFTNYLPLAKQALTVAKLNNIINAIDEYEPIPSFITKESLQQVIDTLQQALHQRLTQSNLSNELQNAISVFTNLGCNYRKVLK